MILAAGWATRMGALAKDRPKHLLPVGERVALDYPVDALERLDALSEIHVVTNERFHGQFAAWARRRRPRAPLRVWSDGTAALGERLGVVGDLQWLLDRIGVAQDTLVLAGDNVFDFPLDDVAEAARHEPVVSLYDTGSPERVRRYASVELDAAGYLTRFVEKDPAPTSGLAAVAIYGLPALTLPAVRRYLAAGGSRDNLGYLAEWLHREMPVRGVVLRGRWWDVGSPDEYARVVEALAPAHEAVPS